MSFNNRTPNTVATHIRKYATTTQLVNKSKAGAIGMVAGIVYYKTAAGVAVSLDSNHTPDGTSALPSMAFASELTLGFYRSAAATITAMATTFFVGNSSLTTAQMSVGGQVKIGNTADGVASIKNNALTFGVTLKFDALPTIASGFGGTPSITAGSTPLAGSVNVGTGGAATTGTIDFNGTAFPSAPFVVVMNTTTGAVVRATTSTTQLIITAPVAFIASDVICWICVSSK
jgi:hypothetical protein